MSNQVKPWSGSETTEKAQRALDRLKESLGVEDLPAGLSELAASEPGIHDIYMNVKRQLEAGKVTRGDKLLVAIGVCAAAGSADALRLFGAAGREAGLSPQNVIDAVSVAGVCSIFNGYYHFRDLTEEEELKGFRAAFNANTFMGTTLSQPQTELICIAVSALNNCHGCVQGHIAKARQLGVTSEQIDELVKASAAAQAVAKLVSALAPSGSPVAT